MADALCGPSNALQSFRKHTQLDRTLQQDRLVGRQSPTQGFRTQDPRTGSLDAELHAFENAHANPFQFHQQPHQPPPPQFAQPSPITASSTGGWAADFQRLHISNTPSPIPVQQFRTEAPLVRSSQQTSANGWHNEFMQHHGKGKEVAREMTPSFQHTQPMPMFGSQPSYAMNGQEYGFGIQPVAEVPASTQHTDAGFDAAFEEAMREMETYQEEQRLQEATAAREEAQLHAEEISSQEESIRIGSDAISYTEQRERTPEQEVKDADELARTAGHLLNLVSHDTSSKFQNSQFLDLMRRIRDREVEVQNNDLQSTDTPPTSQMSAEPPTTILQPGHQQRTPGETDPRTSDPTDTFSFPDLNTVYAPTQADLTTDQYPQSSWQNGGGGTASDADAMYTAAADEYPTGLAADLHPGGRWYPEQKSPPLKNAQMSGGRA